MPPSLAQVQAFQTEDAYARVLRGGLIRLGEAQLADHSCLEPEDVCFCFGQYHAGRGYQGPGANRLILDFKRRPSVTAAGHAVRAAKARALAAIAQALRTCIPPERITRTTWVPIPASQVQGHADYDSRGIAVLRGAFAGYDADIRPLLRVTKAGVGAGSLYEALEVDRAVLDQAPLLREIVLFDDLITSGRHFKCAERRLREAASMPLTICGIFIARRVLPNPQAERARFLAARRKRIQY